MTDLHPGDALSDLLDGRLPAGAASELRAHLLTCAHCAAELDAVRDARRSVRSLPAVEPPDGFLDRLLVELSQEEGQPARSRIAVVFPLRRRAALANAAAAVVAGLFIVATGSGSGPAVAVSPEVGGALRQHASTISSMSAGPANQAPGMAPSQVPEPYLAPLRLGDYRLVRAQRSPDGVSLLYRKAEHGLSVFEQKGDLDLDRLPRAGERLEVDGDEAWRWTGSPAGRVLVVERDGVVVTLVGDESDEAVLAAARALPDRDGGGEPFGARLRRACADALDALSPAG